jgi:leucyl-tRNA synthetase
MEYNFTEIEKKWQARWAKDKTFKASDTSDKPKYYVLDMFPYPSGAGLHVGHPLGYIASDIMARYKRHKGFNVLHPMGYDSFGLPAEQYAIQTGQHPKITTEQNINRYREQMDKIGFSFDWDREVRTSDPEYYKWTQWIFIQIFNSWYNKNSDKAEDISTLIKEFEVNGNSKLNAVCDDDTKKFTAADWKAFSEKEKSDALMHYRIAYLGEAYVNWCPALGTVLANDEVKDGVSERGGHPVERKLMKQWSMRITAYAQRLLDGLDTLDWTESLKESQRYWIGRSEGTSLRFRIIQPHPKSFSKGEGLADNEELTVVEEEAERYWKTASHATYDSLKKFARENKQPLTESEDKLWQAIRNRQLGSKFRRQHPIHSYIADFISLENKLIIEVDGETHNTTKEYDDNRTAALNELGFKVIRFSNNEVKNDLQNILNKIKSELKFSSSAPSPLEKAGDEAVNSFIEVFTTRPDTVFGVSFVTLAPEHDLVSVLTTAENKTAVEDYVTKSKNRSERERQADVTKISGVFTGSYVEHPFTGKQIPIWVGDYVLAGYGTGAVMAVPAHDERDHKFAKHFGLELPQVITPNKEHDFNKDAWGEKEGTLINSDFLNGLDVKAAIKKAIAEIETKKIGKGKTNYRLRDAVFGRQRYWGEPIPIYYKDGIPYALKDSELPLVLPEVDKYLPTEDGEPPLARAKDWKYRPLSSSGGGGAQATEEVYDYELSTMPGWAGSSWYFLRYMDAHNGSEFASKKLMNYWKNVDLYIGGSEHATGHLLYVRFWTKFLKDLGYINVDEPAQKLINQGMIQGRSNFVFRLIWDLGASNLTEKDLPTVFISKSALNDYDYIRDYVEIILKKYDIVIPTGNKKFETSSFNVDVNIVNNDVLDKEAFRNWRNDFQNIEFINEENGDYLCGAEVEKMSKSKYNVVTPDLISEKFGADTLRLYEMFLGPLEQSKPWNTNGITGVAGFLKKLWRLFYSGGQAGDVSTPLNVTEIEPTKGELKTLHKMIKKITEDIERFSFNTSVSNFMICVNELTEAKCNKRAILEPLLICLSPYAPHITEELWEKLGHKESIALATFPMHNEEYLVDDSFTYPISFNGKMRLNIELPATLTVAEIEKEVMSREEVQKYLEGKTPKKIIIVPKKIVNIVI